MPAMDSGRIGGRACSRPDVTGPMRCPLCPVPVCGDMYLAYRTLGCIWVVPVNIYGKVPQFPESFVRFVLFVVRFVCLISICRICVHVRLKLPRSSEAEAQSGSKRTFRPDPDNSI